MATTYLSRTPSSAGNTSVWTASFWIKCSSFTNQDLFNAGTVGTNHGLIFLNGNQQLEAKHYAGSFNYQLVTNRRFRDCNAWYHIVIAYNDLESTSSDRIKFYINGVQETSFATATYPSLNFNSKYNETTLHTIGRGIESGTSSTYRYFDGSMSHFNFIDGTAYDASAFGETDATTGEWVGKTSPSVTYGTNGFFILKDGNGITDQSGEGNDFTLGGGTLTDLKDNPDNVFATWNPLMKPSSASTFSNGNLTVTNGTNSVYPYSVSTQGFSQGKWYAEFKYTPSGNGGQIGIMDLEIATTNFQANNVGSSSNGCIIYTYNGNIIGNGTIHSSGNTSLSNGSIVGVAVDEDNQLIYFYVNGTLQNSGGTDYSGDAFTSGFVGFYCGDASGGGTDTWDANFGNGYFGTTAVSSAGTNASDNGIFEYDVPTGYTALSTKGLNL